MLLLLDNVHVPTAYQQWVQLMGSLSWNAPTLCKWAAYNTRCLPVITRLLEMLKYPLSQDEAWLTTVYGASPARLMLFMTWTKQAVPAAMRRASSKLSTGCCTHGNLKEPL